MKLTNSAPISRSVSDRQRPGAFTAQAHSPVLRRLARVYQEARCKDAEFARFDECIRGNVEKSGGLRCPGGRHAQPFQYSGNPFRQGTACRNAGGRR